MRLTQRPAVGVNIDIRLSEAEARALDALAGYKFEDFVAMFYKHMGKSYLEPYEGALRELFSTIRSELPPILSRLDRAKDAFSVKPPVAMNAEEHCEICAPQEMRLQGVRCRAHQEPTDR